MQPSLKIVIVDKNPIRAAILEDGLGEAGHVVRVDDTSHLLARIYAIDPDVILIDLENPSRDVLEQMFQVSRAVKRPVAMFVERCYAMDGPCREATASLLCRGFGLSTPV